MRKLLIFWLWAGLLLTSCSNTEATLTPTAASALTTVPTGAVLSTPIANPSTDLPTTFTISPTSVAFVATITPSVIAVSNSTTLPTFTPVIAPTPTTFIPPTIPIITPKSVKTNAPLPTAALATIVPITFPADATPDNEEQKFINLLNAYRSSNGVGTLSFDVHLFHSARWLAQDMATKNYVAHTDSLNRDIFKRIRAFGYPSARVGENIAGGFELASDNLNIWQSDQIHKDNLLGKFYTKVGVGRYYTATSLNRWYWVLDFGGA